ncbi:MAG: hypothetical protein ACYDAR_08750 [Thermomicrobiales bacterium]
MRSTNVSAAHISWSQPDATDHLIVPRASWLALKAWGLVAAIAVRLGPLLLFGLIAGRRWQQFDGFVSGCDPGNWFAFGRRMFGNGGKSTAGAYPPLVPMLLFIGQRVADLMIVARIISLGSLIAVIAATYFVARQGTNRWFALAAAMTVGLACIFSSTIAFGGYPQNYALAFGILAAFAFARYLETAAPHHLLAAAAALVGAAISHHMYFAISCAFIAVVWGIWLTTRPTWRAALRRTLGALFVAVCGLACFVPTFLMLKWDGYGAPINIGRLNFPVAIHSSIREAPSLWLAVFTTGLLFIGISYKTRFTALWKVQTALMIAPLALFAITREPRLIPPILIGASLAMGNALHTLWLDSRGTAWVGIPLLLAATVPVLLWPLSDAKAGEDIAYYRVADQSLIRTTDWLNAHPTNGRVVIRENGRGWPVGWWFEGLTHAKIVVGSNTKYLAFPGERDHADLANQFFDQKRTTGQVRQLAAETGVSFLVFKKWEWIGWQAWGTESDPALKIVFDDGEYMIVATNANTAPPALG